MMRNLLTYILCILSFTAIAQGGTLDSFEISKSKRWQGSDPQSLYNFNETLFLAPGDTIRGRHFRTTDGTYFPKVITVPNSSPTGSVIAAPRNIFTHNGTTLYFSAIDTAGGATLQQLKNNVIEQIPVILGTTNDTLTFYRMQYLANTGRYICFYGSPFNYPLPISLFVYDTLTKKTKHVNAKPTGQPIAYNNKFYFAHRTIGPIDEELYEYDPLQDTLIKYDLKPHSSSAPHAFIKHQGVLYFIAASKLYQYNNTTMTVPQVLSTSYPLSHVFGIKHNNNSNSYAITTWGDKLIFVAQTNFGNYKLYEHNLTTNKSKLLDSSLRDYTDIAMYNNKLFFVGDDSVHGYELFVYDWNNPPTLVADIFLGDTSSNPHSLTVVNNRLFFAAEGATIGYELYMYTEATAGIQSTSFKATATLYPNPTCGHAYIRLNLKQNQLFSISVTDMQGRVVHQTPVKEYQKGKHIITLPSEQLAIGNYIYHMSDKQGRTLMSGKLQKQ